MTDRKYFDIAEWQAWGGLQEANRLHFHLHGLALEVTRITDEGDNPTRQKILEVAKDYSLNGSPRFPAINLEGLADAITEALFPVGSVRLSGIWDSRDDPEGIIFGEWSDQDRKRAQNVADERKRHALARERLFYGEVPDWADQPTDPDIEPTDWTYEGDDA